jgi:hypothetical protein
MRIVNQGDLTAFIYDFEIPAALQGSGKFNFEFDSSVSGGSDYELDVNKIDGLQDGLQPGESIVIPYFVNPTANAYFFDHYKTGFFRGWDEPFKIKYTYLISSDRAPLQDNKKVDLSLVIPGGGLAVSPSIFLNYDECSEISELGPIRATGENQYIVRAENVTAQLGRPQTVKLGRLAGYKMDILGPLVTAIKAYVGFPPSYTDALNIVPTFGYGINLWDGPDILEPDHPTSTSAEFIFAEGGNIDPYSPLKPKFEVGGIAFPAYWLDEANNEVIEADLHAIPLIEVGMGCVFDLITGMIPELPGEEEYEDSAASAGSDGSGYSWIPIERPPTPPSACIETGTCPRPVIKLTLTHEITMERDMFVAQVKIGNGLDEYAIENLDIDISVKDIDGSILMNDQYDDGPLWFRTPKLSDGLNDIDGGGVIQPQGSESVEWLIIPTPGAGGTSGKKYKLRASGSFTVNGEHFTFEDLDSIIEEKTITVMPQPKLHLTYYLPKQVKRGEPFYLVLKAENKGYGTARNVIVDENGTAELKLENGYIDKNGTYWKGCVEWDQYGNVISNDPDCGIVHANFTFQDKKVNGEGVTNVSMYTDLGDIGPVDSDNNIAMAYWKLTCDQDGYFTDFSAKLTHSDLFGGRATALIEESVSTEYERFILANHLGSEGVLCAFGNDTVVDVATGDIYSAQQVPHQIIEEISVIKPSMKINVDKADGFIVMDIANPYGKLHDIKKIVAESGYELDPQNYWYEGNRIKIVDDPDTEYTIVFDVDVVETNTGTITLDKSLYTGLSATASVMVEDKDMDITQGAGNDQITIKVISDFDPEGEAISLSEDTNQSGLFAGTFGFEQTQQNGNGHIAVTSGSAVTVSYTDLMNTDGEIETIIERLSGDPPNRRCHR